MVSNDQANLGIASTRDKLFSQIRWKTKSRTYIRWELGAQKRQLSVVSGTDPSVCQSQVRSLNRMPRHSPQQPRDDFPMHLGSVFSLIPPPKFHQLLYIPRKCIRVSVSKMFADV